MSERSGASGQVNPHDGAMVRFLVLVRKTLDAADDLLALDPAGYPEDRYLLWDLHVVEVAGIAAILHRKAEQILRELPPVIAREVRRQLATNQSK